LQPLKIYKTQTLMDQRNLIEIWLHTK